MTYFCPLCWNEIAAGEERCPHCGGDITEFDKGGFKEKLIHALGHPVPETVRVAVSILGRIGCAEAIKPLKDLFEQTDNPFLKIEILEAMGKIGAADAIKFLIKTNGSDAGIVNRKARELLVKPIQRITTKEESG